MFKRVEKRRRRQEEEEELGIDDELKQILGMQDTDSEESDSASESDENSDEEQGEYLDGGDFDEEGSGIDQDDDEKEGKPSKGLLDLPVSVQQALNEPIIPAPDDPLLSFCAVCPGKALRAEKMVQVHLTSNAYVDPQEDALSIVLEKMQSEQSTFASAPLSGGTGGKSKRALKKEASKAFRKAKRDKAKAKKQAKSLVAEPKSDTNAPRPKEKAPKLKSKQAEIPDPKPSPPTKKRRRLSESASKPPLESSTKETAAKKPSSEPPSKPEKPAAVTPSIKSIARSATHRARAALAQNRKVKS
ncbi:hypothetical protein MD484_g8495, partial [Candolleomyces efflorescens]